MNRIEACFNKDIYYKTISLLKGCSKGSIVAICVYNWSNSQLGQNLRNYVNDAAKRGAVIKIVVGHCAVTGFHPSVEIRKYPKGSIGVNKMHNKFITVSTGRVVYQSSANFDAGMWGNLNNCVVSTGDYKLYMSYLNYFKDLWRGKKDSNYYRYLRSSSGLLKGYAFPRKKGDTILSVLNKTYSKGTKIRIAMAYWTSSRSAIITRLKQMQSRGADVKILIRVDSNATYQTFLGRYLRCSGINYNIVQSGYPGALHSKYLLIDGRYYGRKRQMVFTGSHNYTYPSLRQNDEVLLKVSDRNVYDKYLKNWEEMNNA